MSLTTLRIFFDADIVISLLSLPRTLTTLNINRCPRSMSPAGFFIWSIHCCTPDTSFFNNLCTLQFRPHCSNSQWRCLAAWISTLVEFDLVDLMLGTILHRRNFLDRAKVSESTDALCLCVPMRRCTASVERFVPLLFVLRALSPPDHDQDLQQDIADARASRPDSRLYV